MSLLVSAASCGQVSDLGNNGSGGSASAGDSTGGIVFTGGTGDVPSGTGGIESTGGIENTGGIVSTGGTPGTGGEMPVPPDDPCVASVLASQSCVACHSIASASIIGAGLVLEGSNLGARLSTTRATYDGAINKTNCMDGALIIDPESPRESILWKKVTGTQACGDAMPPGSGLRGDNLACIQNWIDKF
jgi:hypothetical protein